LIHLPKRYLAFEDEIGLSCGPVYRGVNQSSRRRPSGYAFQAGISVFIRDYHDPGR